MADRSAGMVTSSTRARLVRPRIICAEKRSCGKSCKCFPNLSGMLYDVACFSFLERENVKVLSVKKICG